MIVFIKTKGKTKKGSSNDLFQIELKSSVQGTILLLYSHNGCSSWADGYPFSSIILLYILYLGGTISWHSECRFKHIGTDLYLSLNTTSKGTLLYTLLFIYLSFFPSSFLSFAYFLPSFNIYIPYLPSLIIVYLRQTLPEPNQGYPFQQHAVLDASNR